MSYATDRLIKNARNALPGSLDNAILLELFNVMNDFFQNSSTWTEDVEFSVDAADLAGTIYYIEPESTASIVRLYSVVDESKFRQKAFMDIPGEITFSTPPSQTGTMTANVILTVTDPVQRDGYPEFPEWVLGKYGTGLLSGVIGRMMMQPAKPYTNLQLGPAHYKAFIRTISDAVAESVHRNIQNGQSWTFPQQFSTRRQRRR